MTVTPADIIWGSYYNGTPPAYAPMQKQRKNKAGGNAAAAAAKKKKGKKEKKEKIEFKSRLRIKLETPEPCAICGRHVTEGFSTYRPSGRAAMEAYPVRKEELSYTFSGVLSDSYGEHNLLPYPASRITCNRCEAVLRTDLIFSLAMVANTKECILVKGAKDPAAVVKKPVNLPGGKAKEINYGDFWKHILAPPDPPFIMAVNRSKVTGGKPTHYIPFATVNYSTEHFIVNLYEKPVRIDRALMKRFFIDTGLAGRIVQNKTASVSKKVPFGLLDELLFSAAEEIRNGRRGDGIKKLEEIAPEIARDLDLVKECSNFEAIQAIRLLRLSMASGTGKTGTGKKKKKK